jgi:DNA-binding protein YbaB
MGKFDDAKNAMKMVGDLKKAQKELQKEVIEVEAGEGAVIAQINGELKVVDLKFDESKINGDYKKLAEWTQAAIKDGMEEAQKIAAEKMKPLMGGLNLPGM